MSYRTLLLHLAEDSLLEAHARYAAKLARAFDGRLVGLSCHHLGPWPSDGAIAFLEGDPLTVEMRAAEDAALAREATFLRECRLACLASFDAVRQEGPPCPAIRAHALGADLVLMAQPERGTRHAAQARAVVDAVLAECPRPVMVLPYAGHFAAASGPAIVAWDGSAGAARAAGWALPLLKRAGVVHLNRLCRPEDENETMQSELDLVKRWLSGHGVEVRATLSMNQLPVAEALLSHAADIGAGLIVMGAWGHRRMTERLLGGATRTMLDAMTAPVLFGH